VARYLPQSRLACAARRSDLEVLKKVHFGRHQMGSGRMSRGAVAFAPTGCRSADHDRLYKPTLSSFR